MLPRRPPRRARPDPGARRLENALHGLAVAGPSPDFEVRLRARLLTAGPVQARAVPVARIRTRALARPAPHWLPRAVAAGAAGVVGIAGVGVATSRALPGQPLYGAKRQIESWQLALTSGPADRGREELSFARTRLAEVVALSHDHDLTAAAGTSAGGQSADRISATLRRMDDETRAGTTDLASAARGGDGQAARELLAFADGQDTLLGDIVPRLPAPAASAADTSRSVLRQVAALARTLPGAPVIPDATPSARQPSTAPSAVHRPRPVPTTTAGPPIEPTRVTTPDGSAAARSPDTPYTWASRRPRQSAPTDPSGGPSDPTLLGVPPSTIIDLLGGQQSGDG